MNELYQEQLQVQATRTICLCTIFAPCLDKSSGSTGLCKGEIFKRSIYAGCQEGLGMSQSGYVSFASKALIHQGYLDLLECCIPSALSMSISPCKITQDSVLESKSELRYKQNKKYWMEEEKNIPKSQKIIICGREIFYCTEYKYECGIKSYWKRTNAVPFHQELY